MLIPLPGYPFESDEAKPNEVLFCHLTENKLSQTPPISLDLVDEHLCTY